ncbi:MAG: MinD/ParA family protein [Gammaproteobacteria bacterium]|nr:cobyrinic acid a,c-diamide synthase [Gammaproteobacteria bacterium]
MQQSEQDQAAGLRALAARKPVKVIAVTSGKGGVGKTNVAVNLSISLAQRGRSSLLLDADLGLANVDVLLGLSPTANLAQVLDGTLALEDVLLEGPAGVKIVPAASGIAALADLDARQYGGLVSAFATLPYDVDFMVIDTASGIGRGVATFCQAADEVLVVVCDEPSSLTDAYALIKVLSRDRGVRDFRVLCNNVRNAAHGETLFRTLLRACDRFLDVRLDYFGMVPADEAVKRAVRRQQAVVECYPGSPAGRAFKELARRADNGEVPTDVPGRPAFFLERRVAGGRALGARTDA